MRITLVLIFLILFALGYQNCVGNTQLDFARQRQSLSSSMAEGPGVYDGKPDNGYYCRVYDNMSCQPQVKNLQGIVKVENSIIHLLQDNCTSTSINFLIGDAAVGFTSLAPDFIGLSRGIFKRCELGPDNTPPTPTEMTEALCTSKQDDVAVILNKNILNQQTDFTINFRDSNSVRSATGQAVTKITSSTGTSYFSGTEDFTLTINPSNSQTAKGRLQAIVDGKSLALDLDCRQANPEPTIIFERDMELSPTWIDSTQLVGYWKLNENNASHGSIIVDSSQYVSNGTLLTDNGGLVKSDPSVIGGSLFFDSANDSIDIPLPADGHLSFGLGSFTYMVWIKKTGNAMAFDMPIWNGGSSIGMAGFDIECGSSGMGCVALISDGLRGPNSQQSAKFADSASLIGRWVLLTAVVDRDLQQLRAYLDGVLISTANISSVGSVTNNYNIQIGSSNFVTRDYFFMGSVDDVSVWNKALSQKEITEIFQRLRPKFY